MGRKPVVERECQASRRVGKTSNQVMVLEECGITVCFKQKGE